MDGIKKISLYAIVSVLVMGCYNNMIIDPWWVFRDYNTSMSMIKNDSLYFRAEYYSFDDSLYLYADGYNVIRNETETNLAYRVRLYIELFSKKKIKNLIIDPKRIELRINDSLMVFDSLISSPNKRNKKEYYYDLQFSFNSIEKIQPIENMLNSKLSGYLITINLNDFLSIDSKFLSIDTILGFQDSNIYLQADDSYSPFR